jgi:hypothetical protein
VARSDLEDTFFCDKVCLLVVLAFCRLSRDRRLRWLSLRVLPRRKRAVPAGELIASGRGGGRGGAEEACVRAGASVGAAML